jgi:tetratricopeptide (TPR) repeat protein
MELKKLYPFFKLAVTGICLLALAGCATRHTRPLPPPERLRVNQPLPPKGLDSKEASNQTPEKPPVHEPLAPQTDNRPGTSVNKPSPMALAALALSGKGQSYLKDGKPDEAIRVLERAVNLHPQNGENYYYLAEAWLLKGNAAQAKEFNHLAAIHVASNPQWIHRVQSQYDRISKIK